MTAFNFDPLLLDSFMSSTGGSFLIKMLVNALALFISAKILEGVTIKSYVTAVVLAIVLAFLNATLGSFLTGLTGITVGILSFVVDAVVLMVASYFLDGFKIKGWLWAFILAIVLAFVNGFLYKIFF